MAGAIGRVFLDANVLYSRTVRDWLGLLYIDEVFEPPFHAFWSEDVLAEAMYHLRQNNPTWDGAKVALVRDRIAGTFEDGRVTDFVVDGSYRGPDHKDAHVHAACVACRADYLLTENRRDFPQDLADEVPYEVLTPDEFLQLIDDASPWLVDRAVQKQIAYWARKTDDVDLGGSLRRANCPGFAARVIGHLQEQALRLNW
jgi:predicted nucleic acid-binding protein